MRKFALFFALFLFVYMTPCPAAGAPITDEPGISEQTEYLPVDDSEEGKPEPALPEIAAINYSGMVNMWFALSFISPKDMNNSLSSSTAGSSSTKITTAYVLGVDAGFFLFSGVPLALGPRLEYIAVSQGKLEYPGSILTMDASLIPILAGASYEFRVPSLPIVLIGDLYLGYGIGKLTTGDPSGNFTYSGGAFVLDPGLRCNYRISDDISAGLSAGYRLAKITRLSFDRDTDTNKKGDILKNSDGSNLTVDLSGLNAGFNISMKF
jgi:hypothetical protein